MAGCNGDSLDIVPTRSQVTKTKYIHIYTQKDREGKQHLMLIPAGRLAGARECNVEQAIR